MAREGRGLLVKIFSNLVDSLKPRSFKGKLVGKDYLGNEYYEVAPPSHSSRQKPSRYYIPEGGDAAKFDEGVPPEWEAWLRQRRPVPPTIEEIERNLAMAQQKKENALKIEQKFKPPGLNPPEEKSGAFPKYEDMELYPGKKPPK